MNYLVIVLLAAFLHQGQCHQVKKRSLFSWRSEAKDQDSAPSGYLPILQVHKYNGIQINPIQGPPVYLPNLPVGDSSTNSFEGQTALLTPEQIQQLDLLNRLASFLPEDNQLQEMDISSLLSYADLIPEDFIDKIKFAVESTKTKEKSKLLKFLAFIKHIKEKKLKPFKYAASVGSKIAHKKKEKLAWLLGAAPSTTPIPEPITEIPVTSYPYNFAYNPYLVQNKQFFNTFSTSAPESFQAQIASFPYQPQFQTNFQVNQQPKIPSNSESQQHQFNAVPAQPAAPQYQTNLPNLQASQYPKFPTHFQFQEVSQPASNQYQMNIPQSADLPTFPGNLYSAQYQPLPAPTAEPQKNKLTYEYKQPPANTFDSQDNASIRQFASSTSNPEPSQYTVASSTPQLQVKHEPAEQQYYSYPSNYILPFNMPQTAVIPRFQQQSFQKSNQEPNKFYQMPAHNDLTPSGSENIEKIDDRLKLEGKPEEPESLKITSELPTSTEITFSKSKQTVGKRTVLRPVLSKSPVYDPSSKDEILKGM